MPIPNTEVKIGEDGIVYMKNNAIFSEYLNEEDQKEIVEGWLSLGIMVILMRMVIFIF